MRAIFALYLEHKSLLSVLRHLQQQKWTTKRWTTKNARVYPGRPYAYQDVLRLLKNVIYTGKIRHQDEIYAGEHAAIVQDGVWQRVQRRLDEDGGSEPRQVRQPSMADPAAELQSCSQQDVQVAQSADACG